jgi:hypothetical protein
MSDHAFEFLQSWTVENVKPTLYEDGETPEHLADDCAWEAKTIGIIKSDLIKAAGGDLKGFMLAQVGPLGLRQTSPRPGPELASDTHEKCTACVSDPDPCHLGTRVHLDSVECCASGRHVAS